MTVSALAMMNTSIPVLSHRSASRTAWAPSRASMYAHRFHLRAPASASNDGNRA